MRLRWRGQWLRSRQSLKADNHFAGRFVYLPKVQIRQIAWKTNAFRPSFAMKAARQVKWRKGEVGKIADGFGTARLELIGSMPDRDNSRWSFPVGA